MLVDGVASERKLFDRDLDGQRGEDMHGRVADLGADAVAGKGGDGKHLRAGELALGEVEHRRQELAQSFVAERAAVRIA